MEGMDFTIGRSTDSDAVVRRPERLRLIIIDI